MPVTVRMRVECAQCGYTEDEVYEFDMPRTKAIAWEGTEPGECPRCAAPVLIQLHRKQRVQ